MAAQNRYLRGDQNTILADVHSFTTIEAGDMLFVFSVDGDRGVNITADNYVFPFTDIKPVSAGTNHGFTARNQFVGVAMESSPSGVTEKIAVATSGIFRYPQILFKGSAVTIGALVSAGSPAAGSAAGVSAQAVYTGTAYPGSTAYLGHVVKTHSGATYIDFQINTMFTGLAT